MDTSFSVSEAADHLQLGGEATRQWIQAYEKIVRTSFRQGSKGRQVPLGVIEEIRQARELLAAEAADSRESALELVLAGGAPEGRADRVGETLERFDEKIDFVSGRFEVAAQDLREQLHAGVQAALRDVREGVVPGFEKRLQKVAAGATRELGQVVREVQRQAAAADARARQNQEDFAQQQALLLNRGNEQVLQLARAIEEVESMAARVRRFARFRFRDGLGFLALGAASGVLGTLSVQLVGWKIALAFVGGVPLAVVILIWLIIRLLQR